MAEKNLRPVKAATIKTRVLDATLKLAGKKLFKDVHVNAICKKSGISKVTFFKYFPQKEDVLRYYHRVWCFRRSLELQNEKKVGLKGVYFLFDKFCDDYETHPGIVLSLIGYYTSLKMPQKPYVVTVEEKKLLFPDYELVEKVEIKSLHQLLEGFLLDAIFHKEITHMSNTRELAQVFISALFGGLLAIHTENIKPAKIFYKKQIDLLVKALK